MEEGWRQFLGVECELLGKWRVALPMDPTSAGKTSGKEAISIAVSPPSPPFSLPWCPCLDSS